MTIYSIYKFTCISTSKVYIGFASNHHKRKHAHKKAAEKGIDTKFYRAIRKYGWSNFNFELIYQSKDKTHTRDVMEPFFINEYDSYKDGYNSTIGGEGAPTVWGDTHPMKREENKNRQGQNVLGDKNPYHKLTVEQKAQTISRLFTKESMDKKSGINHYRSDKHLHKFVNCLTNEVVTMTRHEFTKKYNLIETCVGYVISGKRKTTGGWKLLP